MKHLRASSKPPPCAAPALGMKINVIFCFVATTDFCPPTTGSTDRPGPMIMTKTIGDPFHHHEQSRPLVHFSDGYLAGNILDLFVATLVPEFSDDPSNGWQKAVVITRFTLVGTMSALLLHV